MDKKYFFDIDGTLVLWPKPHGACQHTGLPCISRCAPPVTLYPSLRAVCKDALAIAQRIGISTLVADGGNSVTPTGACSPWRACLYRPACALSANWNKRGIPWAAVIHNELEQVTPDGRYRRAIDRLFWHR